MSEYKEYHLPTTTDEKAQIIHISNKNNVRIDNDKIQEFFDKVVSKRRLTRFMYSLFIFSSIIFFALLLFGYLGRSSFLANQWLQYVIYGTIFVILISLALALIISQKWSADELHIIPIKDYEFKDDNSKILCTTSCYNFEENDKETKLYPVKYIQYDLKNGEVPYMDAYTYRASKYFWMTIHLPEAANPIIKTKKSSQ